MTPYSLMEGHCIYLEWLNSKDPSKLDLGGEIQKPKMKRGRRLPKKPPAPVWLTNTGRFKNFAKGF